jgi:hypothetical protein
MAEEKSITLDEYKDVYAPKLDTIRELILSHQDIPDDVQQSEVLIALDSTRKELERSLNARIPEIDELNKKVASLEKLNRSLQNTTQEYYLVAKAAEQGSLSRLGGDKEKKSPHEAYKEFINTVNSMS